MALGFSNGCAEFALSGPPPLLPSSLIASWLATGPPGMCWVAPVIVVTVCGSARFCTVPAAIRSTVATMLSGSRMRKLPRVRSTQKLPTRLVRERAKPRTSATTTAMPTAAEAKFCTARPAIWTR